jgi:hypothetical protein
MEDRSDRVVGGTGGRVSSLVDRPVPRRPALPARLGPAVRLGFALFGLDGRGRRRKELCDERQ